MKDLFNKLQNIYFEKSISFYKTLLNSFFEGKITILKIFNFSFSIFLLLILFTGTLYFINLIFKRENKNNNIINLINKYSNELILFTTIITASVSSYFLIVENNPITAFITSFIVFLLFLLFLLSGKYSENKLEKDLKEIEFTQIKEDKKDFFLNILKSYFIILKKYIINHIGYIILFISFLSLTIFMSTLKLKGIELQKYEYFIPIGFMIFIGLIFAASESDFTIKTIKNTILLSWYSIVPLFFSISYLFHYFTDLAIKKNNKIILSNHILSGKIAGVKLNNLSGSYNKLEKIYYNTLNSRYLSSYITNYIILSSLLTLLLFTITIFFLKQVIQTNNKKKEILNKLEKIKIYVNLQNTEDKNIRIIKKIKSIFRNKQGNNYFLEKLQKEIENDIQIFIPQFPIDSNNLINEDKIISKILEKLSEKFINK